MKITFNLDIEQIHKTQSIVNKVGKAILKKIVLMLGLNQINTISKTDFYDNCKDFDLSEKGREGKRSHVIQSENDLKAWACAKKVCGMTINVKPRNMQSKRLLEKGLLYLWILISLRILYVRFDCKA